MRKIGFSLFLLLSACSMSDEYARPVQDLPDTWGSPMDIKQSKDLPPVNLMSLAWWQRFNDPLLVQLLQEGLKSNFDLKNAVLKIQEVRAQFNMAEAGRAPTLSLAGQGNRISNSSESLMAGVPLSDKPYNDFGLSTVFNYEIDLWGRVSNKIDAAESELLSVVANKDAITLSILSDIASVYFNLCALNRQIDITEKTLRSRMNTVDYQSKQNRLGAIDTLTLFQAEAQVNSAKADLADLRQKRAEHINTLSYLLGRTPRELIEKPLEGSMTADHVTAVPSLPNDLPSSLLERRPDIYAAEQKLRASNAMVGVARADYYPVLSLSAIFGLGSNAIDKLLQSSARTWQLKSGLNGPIFDLSKMAAIDQSLAQNEQRLIDYKKVVLNAFKEVADAKSSLDTTHARLTALKEQVLFQRKAFDILDKRYKAGYSTYLEWLDAERSLFASEIALSDAERQHVFAMITFAKALGGGWHSETLKDEPMTICDTHKN